MHGRSSEWMPRKTSGNKLLENYKLDMTAAPRTSSPSTELSRTRLVTLCFVWNTWTAGKLADGGPCLVCVANVSKGLWTGYRGISDLSGSTFLEKSQNRFLEAWSISMKHTGSCIEISNHPMCWSTREAASNCVTLVLPPKRSTRLPTRLLAHPLTWPPNAFRAGHIRSSQTCGVWG